MTDEGSEKWYSRRNLLKAGGVATTAALAGCAGGGGGTPTPRVRTVIRTQGGKTVVKTRVQERTVVKERTKVVEKTPTPAQGIRGVQFQYWDVMNVQAEAARKKVETMVSEFESRTGASVTVNFSTYQDVGGPKWINAFERGDYPVVWNAGSIPGWMMQGGYLTPLSDYRDQLDDALLSGSEWVQPTIKYQARAFMSDYTSNGYDDIPALPLGIDPHIPFMARKSHFDQTPGLSWEDDYPPQDYDHLVEVGTALQNDGPGDFGMQVLGANFDFYDHLGGWTVAAGGKDGVYFNESGDDALFLNDVYDEWTTKYNDLYNEHNLGTGQTPTASDEYATQLIIPGQLSMGLIEYLNHPVLMQRAEQDMKSGELKWAPGLGGERAGKISWWGTGLTNRPRGADQQTWERKQEAAIEFLKLWWSPDVQMSLHDAFGIFPFREDQLRGEYPNRVEGESGHQLASSLLAYVEGGMEGTILHPGATAVANEIMVKEMQTMLQGNQSPQEALQTTYDTVSQEMLPLEYGIKKADIVV